MQLKGSDWFLSFGADSNQIPWADPWRRPFPNTRRQKLSHGLVTGPLTWALCGVKRLHSNSIMSIKHFGNSLPASDITKQKPLSLKIQSRETWLISDNKCVLFNVFTKVAYLPVCSFSFPVPTVCKSRLLFSFSAGSIANPDLAQDWEHNMNVSHFRDNRTRTGAEVPQLGHHLYPIVITFKNM